MKIINTFIDELPPKGLEAENREIFAAITLARNSDDTIDNIKNLLKNVESNLFKIKLQYLSEQNNELKEQIYTYYTTISTYITDVSLNKLIEDVKSSKKYLYAWIITSSLNQLPIEPEYKKNHFEKIVTSFIENIPKHSKKFNFSPDRVLYDIIDLRTDNELWEGCKENNYYQQYIDRFPNGSHIKEAKELQDEIERQKAERIRLQEEEKTRKRLLEEAERAKKYEEELERQRQLEIEELYRKEKLERETIVLNWIIGILIILIFFLLIYLFWGWSGISMTFKVFGIIIGIILLLIIFGR